MRRTLRDWNQQLFSLLNAPEKPDGLEVLIGTFIAQHLVLGGPIILIGLWVWGPPARRGALLATSLGVAVALGLNQVLGLLWFEPRPFMVDLGHTLMAHVAENSFPSDHATFMWSLGLGLMTTRGSWIWGWLTCAAGLAVAWARIYLGVHFPIDMAGSLLAAACGAAIARAAVPLVNRAILPIIERSYEGVLRRVHLPPAVFPRNGASEGHTP